MICFWRSAVLAAGSLGLSACATVVNGPNLDYAIASDPVGAKVEFSSGAECVTPCELTLQRKYHQRADISLEGYEPVYVLIQSKTGGATVGNVLAGGMIGVLVDSGNGSNKFLSPRPLSVKLVPLGSEAEAQLLDDDGKIISSVAVHNDEARPEVVGALGRKLAGYEEASIAAAPTVGAVEVKEAGDGQAGDGSVEAVADGSGAAGADAEAAASAPKAEEDAAAPSAEVVLEDKAKEDAAAPSTEVVLEDEAESEQP